MTPSEEKKLDFLLYKHGCAVLKIQESETDFDQGYAQGQFHFSKNPRLLDDLLLVYGINIQKICDEWLASTLNASQFGKTPLKSVLELLNKLPPPTS